MLIGVHPDMQNKGVPAIIFAKIIQTFNDHGLEKAESNPELVHNKNIQAHWKEYESRQHKSRATFVKNLS